MEVRRLDGFPRGTAVTPKFLDGTPIAFAPICTALRAMGRMMVCVSLSRKVYAELPRYPSEKAFVDATLAELEPYFHIEREVVLEHWTSKRLKVDAVMRPREPQAWKDESPS
ncbi:hypothetical protein H7J87_27030 [Mycolicibacterium wolinskyi]|uniref:Uncharacterized protein n=1 Tax=Mycolicibacterium wolinskyi TaxID=59750 RepID=A0A1X2F4N6_9MYCO|nr:MULTISPECIES: hypothetical protein [Mycolicibacterium]MCV7288988.1 hypothetical protein [Mycolicibacterium wolinskyi]MCV7296415.1 hypothetical protein [Mycolicibacterium goodii]ORX13367.1 hypothetical protein AWC31_02275 [Mycolicibacterium wolinskyi]